MSCFRLTAQAKADIREIWDFIGVVRNAPAAASKQVEAIFDQLCLLAREPLLGQLREDLRPGLRVFSAGTYVILYHARADRIDVAGVVHGARDIEGMFHRGER